MNDERQRLLDAFYMRHGPCCAGCDHWRSYNSTAGECTKSAPMPGRERMAMLGIEMVSLDIGAGHAFTLRDHACGDFADTFDWSTLPLPYRRSIKDKSICKDTAHDH